MPELRSNESTFRSWRLSDVVLGILSLAATEGRTKIPILEFFGTFAHLKEEYGGVLPTIIFTKTWRSAYSKGLDRALQELVGCGVGLPNPQLQNLEVTPDAAQRHLAWLEAKYGLEAVKQLKPLADRFRTHAPARQA